MTESKLTLKEEQDRAQTLALAPGSHIYAKRTLYEHHGIYVGNGRVVAFLLETGVTETSFDDFADGDEVYLICHQDAAFSPEEIVARARSREGQMGYNLVFNNCEHFANWCVTGKEKSTQVNKVVRTVCQVVGGAVLIKELYDRRGTLLQLTQVMRQLPRSGSLTLGVGAVALMGYGLYKWMTAKDNDRDES